MLLSPFSASSKNIDIWFSATRAGLGLRKSLSYEPVPSGSVSFIKKFFFQDIVHTHEHTRTLTHTSYLVVVAPPPSPHIPPSPPPVMYWKFSLLSSGNVYDAVLYLTQNMPFNTLIVLDCVLSLLPPVSEPGVMHHSSLWQEEINISFSSLSSQLPELLPTPVKGSCLWLRAAPASVK